MAQTQCKQCYVPIDPGLRFCPHCGATIAPDTITPTVAAAIPWLPAGTPAPSLYGGIPGSSFPPTQYAESIATPPPPPPYEAAPHSSPYAAPTDPYSLPSSGANLYGPPSGGAPSGPYGQQPGSYGPPLVPDRHSFSSPGQKKSSLTMIIIGILVVFVLLLGGGIWAIARTLPPARSNTASGSNSSTGSNSAGESFAKEVKLNNVTITYSSVQITFTSIQQANEFSDDSFTTSYSSLSKKKNYVRINFSEEQQAERSSYYSYRSALRLLLPDKSVLTPLKTLEYSGPERGVKRTNWADFETRELLDLSQLTLRLGSADEAQMELPLKDGTDVSKYQPKKITLNKQFQYATLNWTLKGATQSYYFQGKQARTNKVYITVELRADNNSVSRLYFYSDFVRLQAGETVAKTEYGSDLNDFTVVEPDTTNHQGTATFLVPPSNSYTLQFLAGRGFDKQTIDFSLVQYPQTDRSK